MACSAMIYGPKLQVCVTFETGQEDFMIYKRNYNHSFKVKVNNEHRNECHAMNLSSQTAYCIAD